MNNDIRHVYYISDSTGITVESLGRSVLSQFDGIRFVERTLSFIDTKEKVIKATEELKEISKNYKRPIVFFTFANEMSVQTIKSSGALMLDCLEFFVTPLSLELQRQPLHISGERWTKEVKHKDYQRRIDALNFTMTNDDGISIRNFDSADIILIGVSRSGKTPTSLYLALHYGIFTANYPLVNEDLESDILPRVLKKYQNKLYGLLISPKRLTEIRHQRRPGSQYANPQQCQNEISACQRLFDSNNIPYLDVTKRSVEELASKILQEAKLARYL